MCCTIWDGMDGRIFFYDGHEPNLFSAYDDHFFAMTSALQRTLNPSLHALRRAQWHAMATLTPVLSPVSREQNATVSNICGAWRNPFYHRSGSAPARETKSPPSFARFLVTFAVASSTPTTPTQRSTPPPSTSLNLIPSRRQSCRHLDLKSSGESPSPPPHSLFPANSPRPPLSPVPPVPSPLPLPFRRCRPPHTPCLAFHPPNSSLLNSCLSRRMPATFSGTQFPTRSACPRTTTTMTTKGAYP